MRRRQHCSAQRWCKCRSLLLLAVAPNTLCAPASVWECRTSLQRGRTTGPWPQQSTRPQKKNKTKKIKNARHGIISEAGQIFYGRGRGKGGEGTLDLPAASVNLSLVQRTFLFMAVTKTSFHTNTIPITATTMLLHTTVLSSMKCPKIHGIA